MLPYIDNSDDMDAVCNNDRALTLQLILNSTLHNILPVDGGGELFECVQCSRAFLYKFPRSTTTTIDGVAEPEASCLERNLNTPVLARKRAVHKEHVCSVCMRSFDTETECKTHEVC